MMQLQANNLLRAASPSPSIDSHIVIDSVHAERPSEVTRLMGGGSGFTSAKGLGFLACSTRHDWPPTRHSQACWQRHIAA